MNFLIQRLDKDFLDQKLEELLEVEQDLKMLVKIFIDKHYYQEVGLNKNKKNMKNLLKEKLTLHLPIERQIILWKEIN